MSKYTINSTLLGYNDTDRNTKESENKQITILQASIWRKNIFYFARSPSKELAYFDQPLLHHPIFRWHIHIHKGSQAIRIHLFVRPISWCSVRITGGFYRKYRASHSWFLRYDVSNPKTSFVISIQCAGPRTAGTVCGTMVGLVADWIQICVQWRTESSDRG
jgi:hypothetical protein